MASDPAAIAQSGLAAFAGITIEKSVLAFAPDFRRLILAFHFFLRFKSIDIATLLGGNPVLRGIRDPECEKIAVEAKVSTAQMLNLALLSHLSFWQRRRRDLFVVHRHL
jgi:hypothetical protein